MKSILSSKKGQVGNLAPAIIALVLAATILVMGLIVVQSMNELDIVTQVNTANIVNESGAYINTTGYTLVGASAPAFNSVSITTAINATDGVVITSGNWSVSSTGVVTNATALNWEAVNITYTYLFGDEAYNSGSATLTGLGTFSDFWTIIVLAIVITVVIGLLLAVFGRRQR